jgi:hypothetical protein
MKFVNDLTIFELVFIGIIIFFFLQSIIYLILIFKLTLKPYKVSIYSEAKEIINNPDKFLDEKFK